MVSVSGRNFIIIGCFHGSNQNLFLIFVYNKAAEKFKNISALQKVQT
jgi:hypothetical protein